MTGPPLDTSLADFDVLLYTSAQLGASLVAMHLHDAIMLCS
jgi:hypothetical protein